MKKIFLIFLILGIFNFTAIPAISSDKTVKKPMVSVFNRAIKNGDIEKVYIYPKVLCKPLSVRCHH